MNYAEVEERILGGTTARRGDVVITRGEVYAIKNGVATHCATMQQTLMTMHQKD